MSLQNNLSLKPSETLLIRSTADNKTGIQPEIFSLPLGQTSEFSHVHTHTHTHTHAHAHTEPHAFMYAHTCAIFDMTYMINIELHFLAGA